MREALPTPRLNRSYGSIFLFIALAAFIWALFPGEAAAQSQFTFSNGNRLAMMTCDLLRLTEGNLGSLVMVCAGLGALIAAAGGNYKVGYSLLAVAVFAFTVRAGVLMFFDANIADCEEDGNQQTGRSAEVKSQARVATIKDENRAESFWNAIDSKPESAAAYGRTGSTRLARKSALNGGSDGARSSTDAAQALGSGTDSKGSTVSAVSASGYDCAIDFQLSPGACVAKGASVDVHIQVKSLSGSKCWPCNLEIQSADLGYHSDPLLATALSDVVAVPDNISSERTITFTASAYGCGPKVPQLPSESITLPVCQG